jgi:AcrR family transcriptional regulator
VPSSDVHVPIWARPQPGTRRPKFTREEIAEAALAIADADGFEAVSMRRIAATLHIGTMSLYHYVQSKDDLIDLMDDAILGEALVPVDELPESWRAALTAIAYRTCEALVRHPWAIQALQGAAFGPNTLRHIGQSMGAVAKTGLHQAQQIELLALVDDYVFGYALRLSEVQAGPPAVDEEVASTWVRQELATGAYPGLDASMMPSDPDAAWQEIAAGLTDQRRFERGLRAVLDGAQTLFGLE